jgi:hypothetical protein
MFAQLTEEEEAVSKTITQLKAMYNCSNNAVLLSAISVTLPPNTHTSPPCT